MILDAILDNRNKIKPREDDNALNFNIVRKGKKQQKKIRTVKKQKKERLNEN